MSNQEILVIEDDADISELVQYNLERQGFKVHAANDGEDGLQMAQTILPSLIILDIMLPGVSGLKVCQKLREHGKTAQIPIVMLSAKGEEADIVTGLELGADDYVPKPFSPNELVARVRSVLRRVKSAQSTSDVIEAGPLRIDLARHEVLVNGSHIPFTLAEFNVLRTLASKPGRVFTRDQLLEKISGGDTYLIDRNVDVHVRAIRKKLGDDSELITTIRGVGYKCRD
jgi:DNA-binding response OmpR family regulator